MDAATGDIQAAEFTSSDKGDSPELPHLFGQIPPDEQIGTGTGDGVFDARPCHAAILERGGTAVMAGNQRLAQGVSGRTFQRGWAGFGQIFERARLPARRLASARQDCVGSNGPAQEKLTQKVI